MDDDCDGLVDESAVAEMCNGMDDDCDGEVDENARPEVCGGGDDDCDGNIDEWVCGGDTDGGVGAAPDAAIDPPVGVEGGCGCRIASSGGADGAEDSGRSGGAALALLGLAAVLGRRRLSRRFSRSRGARGCRRRAG